MNLREKCGGAFIRRCNSNVSALATYREDYHHHHRHRRTINDSRGPRVRLYYTSLLQRFIKRSRRVNRVVPPDLDVASLEKFFAAKPLEIRLRPRRR